VIHVPSRDEFAAFLKAQAHIDGSKLTVAALRDLARMVEIAHLIDDGFLGSSAVLSGGMAMRLRGSTRLTMLDADLSATRAADVSEDDVRDVLEVQEDEITIVPVKVESKVDLVQAFPVRFTFLTPPASLARAQRHFKVDISARGLELECDELELRHDYPFELGIEGLRIPTMHLIEQLAEKSVSFGIFRPAKHYADLAFAADHYAADLERNADTLRSIAEKKFAANKQRFPQRLAMQRITDYGSMRSSFVDDYYLRAVKFAWRSEIAYVGSADRQYDFNQARQLVDAIIVPILFPRR
jgi:hypothetical protein